MFTKQYHAMFSTLGTDQLSLNFNNHKPPSRKKVKYENEPMESTHHGFVLCPLARETNQGLAVPDPNPRTQLKNIIRELYWKILCWYPSSLASQTHYRKRGKGLVNCIYKPCPTGMQLVDDVTRFQIMHS